MNRVFLAGSRKLSRLPLPVLTRLQQIVGRGMEIVVGDANGADRALQAQLAAWNYAPVTVYHVGKAPRNNVGGWPTRRIDTAPGAKGFDFYATKDRAMAEDADCGLMLWDGLSRGTLGNVSNLVEDGKPVAVYVSPLRRCVSVRTPADLDALTSPESVVTHATRSQVALEFT
jgi:hypothetical protein